MNVRRPLIRPAYGPGCIPGAGFAHRAPLAHATTDRGDGREVVVMSLGCIEELPESDQSNWSWAISMVYTRFDAAGGGSRVYPHMTTCSDGGVP